MKKIIPFLFLLFLSVVLIACGKQSDSTDNQQLLTYQSISLTEVAEKMQNKESFYLYVGRPTCQYCATFSPNLEKAIVNTQVLVYYLNTDEEDAISAQAFAENEEIKTVPNLAYYQDGQKQTYLEKGSQASLQEIEAFLMQE